MLFYYNIEEILKLKSVHVWLPTYQNESEVYFERRPGDHGDGFDGGEARDLVLETVQEDGQAVLELITQAVT